MARRIVELTIKGLTNDQIEYPGNRLDKEIEKALLAIGIYAEVTDEIDIELDEDEDEEQES